MQCVTLTHPPPPAPRQLQCTGGQDEITDGLRFGPAMGSGALQGGCVNFWSRARTGWSWVGPEFRDVTFGQVRVKVRDDRETREDSGVCKQHKDAVCVACLGQAMVSSMIGKSAL